MKEFIIFVCTDSTEIVFSKLRSAGLNYNLPSIFTDSYCAGVSNRHCLLTFSLFYVLLYVTYVPSCFAIILMGKRELVTLLCLPGVSWLLCVSSSQCHGFVCSLILWHFLIILTIFGVTDLVIRVINFHVRGISRILFEVGIPNLLYGYTFWCRTLWNWPMP